MAAMTAQQLLKRPAEEILAEIDRGGRFVYYQYVISIVVLTFRRTSDLEFVPAGESVASHGWRYSLVTALFGWWGIPWGVIRTPQALNCNLHGGIDVTVKILAQLRPPAPPAPISFDKAEPVKPA
jgi:hypothetical protein